VPFTLVTLENAGHKTNLKNRDRQYRNNPKKKTTQNTAKQNYPGLVHSIYDTRPGNEVGLFYNAPELTRGPSYKRQ